MKRVLFAWELGANLGHVSRLVPLARTLQARGHDVLFALRELGSAAEALTASGLRYVPSPALPFVGDPRKLQVSYADLLAANGFADPRILPWALRAWLHLLDLARPDLVVLDHAPCALLACRVRGQPHLAVGTGFAIPPAESPLPSIVPWQKVTPEALASAEAPVLAQVNAAARAVGHAGFGALHELFDPAHCALATFPELDHYSGRRGATYHGSSFVTDSGRALNFRGDGGAKVFVYLRDARVAVPVAEALAARRADAVLFTPDLPAAVRERLAASPLQVTDTPARLDALLPHADAVVCSAGHGLLSASLLAGVPLVAIPGNTEQALSAQRAASLGAAASFMPATTAKAFPAALDEALQGKLREKARAFAQRYPKFEPRQVVATLTRRMEEMLATKS